MPPPPTSQVTSPAPSAPASTIALFGTSADPPTVGHGQILEWLSQHFEGVAVWASDNPFKTHGATLAQRQAMVQILVQQLPPRCSNVWVEPDLSHQRTLHTLATARDRWPQADFTLVIGSDLVPQLPHWYQAALLLSQVRLLVVPRPQAPLQDRDLQTLQHQGARITVANFTGLPVSSTAYRREGLATAIPGAIAAYIQTHRLYPRVSPCQTLAPANLPQP